MAVSEQCNQGFRAPLRDGVEKAPYGCGLIIQQILCLIVNINDVSMLIKTLVIDRHERGRYLSGMLTHFGTDGP